MTRTRHPSRILYLLLFVWMAIAMRYYVAGVAALREIWFRGGRHGVPPFGLNDDGRLSGVDGKTTRNTGIANGDILVAVNGSAYTGDSQRADAGADQFTGNASQYDDMTLPVITIS